MNLSEAVAGNFEMKQTDSAQKDPCCGKTMDGWSDGWMDKWPNGYVHWVDHHEIYIPSQTSSK